MKLINSDVSEKFLEQFLTNYLKSGLGSMSKKDTDSLIVWLISKYGAFYLSNGDVDTYKLSLAMKVPHKRIQELLFNARLRFEEIDNEKMLLSEISKALLESKFIKIGENEIKITITDSYTRQALENEIRQRKGMFERYLNGENISVDIDTLGNIMSQLCEDEQWKEIHKNFSKSLTISTANKESFFIEMLKLFLAEAFKEAGGATGRMAISALTGGFSDILNYLIKGVKR